MLKEGGWRHNMASLSERNPLGSQCNKGLKDKSNGSEDLEKKKHELH